MEPTGGVQEGGKESSEGAAADQQVAIGVYYLHSGGDLIFKRTLPHTDPVGYRELLESAFVVAVWAVIHSTEFLVGHFW